MTNQRSFPRSCRLSLLGLSAPLLFGCKAVITVDDGGPGGGSPSSGTSVTQGSGTPTSSSATGTTPVPPHSTQKVDVVFAVDNSADGGEALPFVTDAATALLTRLANPECVDAAGNVQHVASPADVCPAGFQRAFAPASDMHVGVITSSLGGLGGGVCETDGTTAASNPSNDDRGHLIWRTGAPPTNTANTPGTTYQDQGFFAWDATASASPPGITDLATLTTRVTDVMRGAGSVGCGLEMPLESAYRFLVDPAPYDTLVGEGNGIVSKSRSGVDAAVLTQRDAFLRPDSVVVVVMIGSANDCSIVAEGQSWGITRPTEPWYRGSSTCAISPADACCYSCGLATPAGCAVDPDCDVNPRLTFDEDPINLRCSMQKQRYGSSFLYPVDRYVNAFSAPTIAVDAPDLASGTEVVPNPLFAARSVEDVFFVSIGGVPWQATVDDPAASIPRALDAQQRAAAMFDARYVGNTDAGIAPTESLMIESIDARPGIAPGNPFNGKEYAIPDRNDLQLACIFPLATPIPDGNACVTTPDRPTCNGTTQTHGAAYPTGRQLQLTQGLGAQGIVGSMCPPEAVDVTSPVYGYRVAVEGLARSLRGR